MNMRILFIGHSGYGYPHTRVRCYHFAKFLSTMPGVETAVLSFRDDLAPNKSEAAMYESLRDREKLILTWKALCRLFHEKQTVLYIQKAHFHAAAPYLLHRLGFCPDFIFDYDDYDIPLSNFFFRGTLNRLFFGTNRWDEITYRLARRARGCVAASHALRDFLHQHNNHVSYIPTGVDDSVFFPADPKPFNDTITFFWNGLVWGEPIVNNLLLMTKAFHAVQQEIENVRLLIIGGGAKWDEVKNTVQHEYGNLFVEFRDWIQPERMPELLRSVDIGLLPVSGNDQWLQSKSPTKLFEYMATGLPVIASAVGEVNHVLSHLESGFLAHNDREFTEGMIRLARSVSLRNELGTNARKSVVQHYALPVLGENLYWFLKDILSEKLSRGRSSHA